MNYPYGIKYSYSKWTKKYWPIAPDTEKIMSVIFFMNSFSLNVHVCQVLFSKGTENREIKVPTCTVIIRGERSVIDIQTRTRFFHILISDTNEVKHEDVK